MEGKVTCKRCAADIPHPTNYCNVCGAKYVTERITFRRQLHEVASSVVGWDNLFFATIKALILNPSKIFKDYISGVRKKYSNPFTFFAISAAFSLLIFNFFADDFIKRMREFNEAELNIMMKHFPKERHTPSDTVTALGENAKPTTDNEALKEETMASMLSAQRTVLKYYNLAAFLLLPLYAFIAFLVFGRPYNYGEHLVINAYIQGLMMLWSTISFSLELLTGWPIFTASFFVQIIYYMYAHQRLYQLTAEQVFVCFLRFIGFALAALFTFLLLGVLIGIAIALLGLR